MADAIVVWVKSTSLSHLMVDIPWLWVVCESLHFVGLALLLGAVGAFDLRLLGYMRRVSLAELKRLVPFGVAGFLLCLVTGVMFLAGAPEQYIANEAWWWKVCFLAIAGVNMLFFETTQGARMLALEPGTPTPRTFKIVGAVSIGAWLMVLYWGRMMPFVGNAF
jgi:hypothetical protein